MLQFILGKASFFRLDAGPLDRKPMGIMPQLFYKIKILFVKFIVTTGLARLFLARSFFPRPPVRISVAPLDLIGGRRSSPKKI